MNRSKFIVLIIILAISIISGVATFYLAINGLLNLKLMGIDLIDWFFIILCLFIIIVIGYDFIKIQTNKKKYGPLKYVLIRTNKKTQIIGFVFLLFMFILEFFIMIILNKNIKLMDVSLVFLMGMLPLMFGFHNYEKDGLNDKCIYFWGTPIKWHNITAYTIENNILYLTCTKKMFGRSENSKIPFIINNENKPEIIEFINTKI